MSTQIKNQSKGASSSLAPLMPVRNSFLQRKCACGTHTIGGSSCDECSQGKTLQRRSANAAAQRSDTGEVPSIVHETLRSPGQPLDARTRSFMEQRFSHDFSGVKLHSSGREVFQTKLTVNQPGDRYEQEADHISARVLDMPAPLSLSAAGAQAQRQVGQGQAEHRFDHDFSRVRVHTDARAAESARQLNALAYTVGRDVVFGANQYAPETVGGRSLLAHELTHVLQQASGGMGINLLQRRDLASPRLMGNPRFEATLDNKDVIEFGDKGAEVRRIQQLLIDLGFDLSGFGADGDFGSETKAAVKAFQVAHGLTDDGRVGFSTIDAFDKAFPSFTLPAKKSDPWTMSCVLGILCPWNKNLVENVLPGISIVTFDSRKFPTETWDGAAWQPGTFVSGGFTSGDKKNMGFLNTTTCEGMALTIYHEGWHGQQPGSLTGVVDTERDAYVNTEQWSISMGIPGQNFKDKVTGSKRGLRKPGSGETVVDEAAAEDLVRQEYGGVSATPGERILSRVGASRVRVRKPDRSEYEREANVGESVRGTAVMTNLRPISPTDWDCP